MDLYAEKVASLPQKVTVTMAEALILALSGWILFAGGAAIISDAFGWSLPAGIPARRFVVFTFSLVVFCRVAVTMFRFMRRGLAWSEGFGIAIAFALYYLGFAILVLPSDAPLDLADGAAIVLFLLGSYLNTGAELARDRFKRVQQNKRRLYTEGLFALSRHINFFGDILWVAAYAIVAHTPWAWLIPLFTLSFFGFYNAPALDRHLAEHYGSQFTAYASRTKMLVPFLW